MANQRGILAILSGERRDVSASVMRAGLSLIEPGYRVAVSWRNRRFDCGGRPALQLPRPVISVGNLTTGGTGKTPMVIELCRMLIDQGHTPGVLLRGYGGDEAVELAEAIGEAGEVEPNPDRVAGASAMLERRHAVNVFVLDDGFQHRQVARDLDLVLIDATNPWGYGHVLPRGLLREPAAGLRRADAVVVTRADRVSSQDLASLEQAIERHHGRRPIAQIATSWGAVHASDGSACDLASLRGRRLAAICGIGNPDVFFSMLEQAGVQLVTRQAYADHAGYDAATVKRLESIAGDAGADGLVMTEKDWVKWRGVEQRAMVVYRPQLSVDWLEGRDAIEHQINTVFQTGVSDGD